ncbi:virulence-related protein [Paradesulfitobacterium ferrireducens]|uniref:virulence-related protein n=1 Tax=Paradesulfitobacterium ferrireducens TaxID=2816476 RepID=UPI001A8C0FE7|nr:virulence-related protein [Paradesulfitobacterium ferrireducens]
MDKKEMLQRLAEHSGEKPKYMGAPSFAYQVTVGDEVYTIDRDGKIKNSEGQEVELAEILTGESAAAAAGKAPEILEETWPQASISEAEPPVDRMEVVLPLGEHTVYTLRNLINMIASKQDLIQRAFNLKQVIVQEEFTKAMNEKAMTVFQDFESIAHEVGTEKCPGIAFDFDLKTITFQFYEGELDPDKLKAYTDLVTLIHTNAQNLKRASWKPAATDNPKYSFRTWLLRLGMIGQEYKTARKVLLANLEGNSAFRKAGGQGE